MNVLHYRYSGTPPAATDLNGFCSAFGTGFGTNAKALFATNTTLTTLIATDLQGNTGQQGTSSPGQAGTDIRTVMPASACVVQSHKVNARYRGGHPRTYWPPGVTAQMQDTQHWIASWVAGANTTLNTWLASVVSQTFGGTTIGNLCAVSYYHDKVLRPTPLVLDVVASSTLTRIGQQRKRLVG
jgi:hypothetical protein